MEPSLQRPLEYLQAGALRLQELNALIQIEEGDEPKQTGRLRCRHPEEKKRRNWLKFCRKCGVDISKASAYVRLCGKCEAIYRPASGQRTEGLTP